MFASGKIRILANDSLKLCFYKKPIKRVESMIVLGYYTTRNFIMETSHSCIVTKS